MRQVLAELGKRGVVQLMVEGGGKVLGAFIYQVRRGCKQVHSTVIGCTLAPSATHHRHNAEATTGHATSRVATSGGYSPSRDPPLSSRDVRLHCNTAIGRARP